MRRAKVAFKPKLGITKPTKSAELSTKVVEGDTIISSGALEEINLNQDNSKTIDSSHYPDATIDCSISNKFNESKDLANNLDEARNITHILSSPLNDESMILSNDQSKSQKNINENKKNEMFDQLVTNLITLSQSNNQLKDKECEIEPYNCQITKPLNSKPKSKTDYNEPLHNSVDNDDQNELNLTMKDLVFKNPQANPMKSPIKVNSEPKRSVEITLTPIITQTHVTNPSSLPQQTLAPKVKIGPDGQIIIDSESLYVPNPSQNNDILSKPAVQEDYDPFSYLRYFKKSANHKIWSRDENIKFYKALSNHGINLTAITQEFPNRQRSEIKKKFKREEKINGNMIDIALAQNPKLDYFLSVLYPNKNVSSVESKNTKRKASQNKKTQGGEMTPGSSDENSLISQHTSDDDDDVISLHSEINAKTARRKNKCKSDSVNARSKRSQKDIPGSGKKMKSDKIILTRQQYDTANTLLQQITGNKIKDLASIIPPKCDKKVRFIQTLFAPYQSDANNCITIPEHSSSENVISEETVFAHEHNTCTDTLSVLEQNITNAIQEGLVQDSALEETIATGQVLLLPQQYYIKNQIYQVYLVPVSSSPTNSNQEGSEIT